MAVEEIIDESVTVSEDTSRTDADLDGFVVDTYLHLIPESVRDECVNMLATRAYGWKSRARKLMLAYSFSTRLKELQDEIVESFEPKERVPRSPEDKVRRGLTALFNSYDAAKLEATCIVYNIQYDPSNTSAIVEALVDKFLATV